MFKDYFKYNSVLVLGFGVEGRGVCSFLRKCGYEGVIFVYDERIKDNAGELNGKTNALDNKPLPDIKGVEFIDIFDIEVDLVIRSPGFHLEKKYYENRNVTSATNIFFELVTVYKKAKIVGVTGTKGKSTVSSMIHFLLSKKYKSFLVGNIGTFCLDLVDEITADSVVVFELSSYQLSDCRFYPDIAVLLEVTEDHLNFHATKEAYQNAKLNMIAKPQTRALGRSDKPFKQKVISTRKNLDLVQVQVDYCEDIEKVSGLSLLGKHNEINAKYAVAVAQVFGCEDLDFTGFESLPHRLENIGAVGDLTFIDDSLATVPCATISGLEALEDVVVLILGGMDRGIDFKPLVEYLHKFLSLERVILMPDSGERMYDLLKEKRDLSFTIHRVMDIEQAFAIACECNRKGYVLFSPSSPRNPDRYGYTYARGERLRALIAESNQAIKK